MKINLVSINLRMKCIEVQKDFESFVSRSKRGKTLSYQCFFQSQFSSKLNHFLPLFKKKSSRCDKGYLCHKRAEQTNKRAECGESK